MKKGNITTEQLLHILDDEALCKQLLNEKDNEPFLDGTISKEEYLNEFAKLLNGTVLIIKNKHNFEYLPLVIKILNKLYLEKMREEPFSFYENAACIHLYELLQEYPKELEPFHHYLTLIHFEYYQNEIGKFYHKRMKENKILNDYELKDLLNYLMIYKNRLMPHYYLRYLFFVLFEKDHKLKLTTAIYTELFRFLILDLLNQLNYPYTVQIETLEKEKPFVLEGNIIWINQKMIKDTLEENLSYFPYLFDLFEKRYKYMSLVHNKYEEIKSKKQATIKELSGSSFFYEQFSYLSIEREIVDQSLIDRLRFFEDVAPYFYKKIIEDYEKQILQTVKEKKQKKEPVHLILTIDDLLDQTVLLAPEVIQNKPYLKLDYHEDGSRKKIVELLEDYENERITSGNNDPNGLAHYYAKTMLTTSLNITRLADEVISLIEYKVKVPQTEKLLEQIFCEYFVSEINDNIHNHLLTHQELEVILSKFNQYMLKYYEVEQKKISKYLVKNPEKWRQLNGHLNRLYRNVQYMSRPELYENAYLNLTQVLEADEAKNIQKKILKKKIISQKFYMAILIILILIFSISLFLLARIVWQYWSADSSYGKIQEQMSQKKPLPIVIPEPDPNRTEFPMNENIPQMDFKPLQEENEEVVAWIRIDDTDINYPVVQGENNSYYLDHLYNKKYNISGSIFGDYRNNKDFTSDNTVLYGHNMRNGTMFGSLKKYKDESFLEDHKYIWLITPKATYQYEVYAAYEFNSLRDDYVFNFDSEESFQKYLEQIKERSIISSTLEVGPEDQILTLSTCTEEVSVKRFIVVAKKVVTYVVIDEEMSN